MPFLGCARCVDKGIPESETSGSPRYSLGIYAGRYCDECWDEAGCRKEGRSGFDPADAGESYEEE